MFSWLVSIILIEDTMGKWTQYKPTYQKHFTRNILVDHTVKLLQGSTMHVGARFTAGGAVIMLNQNSVKLYVWAKPLFKDYSFFQSFSLRTHTYFCILLTFYWLFSLRISLVTFGCLKALVLEYFCIKARFWSQRESIQYVKLRVKISSTEPFDISLLQSLCKCRLHHFFLSREQ